MKALILLLLALISYSQAQTCQDQLKTCKKNLENVIPGSCEELTSVQGNSANYQLDLDGKDVGMPPIDVQCLFDQGLTAIGRSTNKKMDNCLHQNCIIDLSLNYPELMQMKLFKEQSMECHQNITFKCTKQSRINVTFFSKDSGFEKKSSLIF